MDAAMWEERAALIDGAEARRAAAGIVPPVAITGATGFLGINLVETLLEAGLVPRLLVRNLDRVPEAMRSSVEVVKGDLDDSDALCRLAQGCGTMLHLAGLVRAPSAAHFDHANRAGTENLVGALHAGASGARLVYVSSLAAAGPSPLPKGRSVGDEPTPVSAYGASKLGGEVAVRRYQGPWSILRPPAIYGPRDTDILQFFKLTARGVVPLPAGERWVTLAYVADVVRAILAAAAGSGTGSVLFLGEPSPRTMDEIVTVLAATGDVKARVVHLQPWLLKVAGGAGDLLQRLGFRGVAMTSDKVGELLARHWTAQTEDSLRQLGIGGFVPLERGARVTWEWYREHGWIARGKMRAA